ATCAAPAPPLVPGALRAAWDRHRDAIAVDDGDRARTYAELSARRDGWSAALASAGVRPGDRVAVRLPGGFELLAALAAVWDRGAVYVPLDPSWADPRIARCLRAADARFAIVEDGADLAGTRPITARDLAGAGAAPAPVVPTPDALSHVYFTSGTTGEPKAVALSHEGLAELYAWIGAEYPPDALAAVSATASPAFDFSLFELLAPSIAGGRVVWRRSLHQLLDEAPPGLTMLSAVPGVFTSAFAHAGRLPPGLRAINFGGEALSRGLVRSVRAATPATLRNLYGPAEATMLVTCETVPADATAPSVGRAIGRDAVFVADPDGEPVLPGVRGEVVAIGPSVGRGYLDGDPGGFFVAGDARGYRTGDVGHADPSGRIHLVGRRDRRVKIRGVRLELAAIEDVVEELAEVRSAAATYDGERLRLYLVLGGPTDGVPAEDLADRLADHVRRTLVDAAVPDELLRVDALPVSSSGKVDRELLPARVIAPLPRSTARYVAPTTALETLVALVWAEVLGLERVGVEDDFFAIGGHSLAAVEVLATLDRLLAASVPPAELQRLRTVSRSCARLRERADGRDLEQTAARVVEVLTMPDDQVDAALNPPMEDETRHA
ncbi:MAG: non-ribosomal peptide synthetase, partial [Myxococcota bacterium]